MSTGMDTKDDWCEILRLLNIINARAEEVIAGKERSVMGEALGGGAVDRQGSVRGEIEKYANKLANSSPETQSWMASLMLEKTENDCRRWKRLFEYQKKQKYLKIFFVLR